MPAELMAIFAAVSYALFTVYGWFGLTYSSALVAILVSLASRTVMLWLTVVFTGGIPLFAPKALWVFVGLGVLQSATSLLTFVGLEKKRHCAEPAATQYLSAVDCVDCDQFHE
jgi:uncharacterized membrane protein